MDVLVQLHDVEDDPGEEGVPRTGRVGHRDVVGAGHVGVLVDIGIASPVGLGDDDHFGAVFEVDLLAGLPVVHPGEEEVEVVFRDFEDIGQGQRLQNDLPGLFRRFPDGKADVGVEGDPGSRLLRLQDGV